MLHNGSGGRVANVPNGNRGIRVKSQSLRKSKWPKFQKIDFLLSTLFKVTLFKDREVERVRIKILNLFKLFGQLGKFGPHS